MFQVGFGLNAFQSGLLMLGLFAGNLGMKTVTTPRSKAFGFRKVLNRHGILTVLLMLVCAALTPHTPRIVIVFIPRLRQKDPASGGRIEMRSIQSRPEHERKQKRRYD